jgi:ribosomal protein S18 acetylase RimI-like enzyme
MRNSDVSRRILELERLCFACQSGCLTATGAWSTVNVTDSNIYVVESYGYALGVRIGDEFELLRIGVLPEFRGQGLGFKLMQGFLAQTKGAVFLEVASMNNHAVALYKKCGFVEVGRRKGYYGDDDALIMRVISPS